MIKGYSVLQDFSWIENYKLFIKISLSYHLISWHSGQTSFLSDVLKMSSKTAISCNLRSADLKILVHRVLVLATNDILTRINQISLSEIRERSIITSR